MPVGLVLRRRDGRFRQARAATSREAASMTAHPIPDQSDRAVAERDQGDAAGLRSELAAIGETPGERATLLQFSSAFCAPCRATRRILGDVAEITPGVRHIEVDAEAHLELVRRLKIMRTPTVLVLDGASREIRRASGAPPTRDAVFAALDAAVADQ
jgi:thiol-disulfide isomerase/thioredoxin